MRFINPFSILYDLIVLSSAYKCRNQSIMRSSVCDIWQIVKACGSRHDLEK